MSTEFKKGDRIKYPKRKTYMPESFKDFKSQYPEKPGQVITINFIGKWTLIAIDGKSTGFSFYPQDLEIWQEDPQPGDTWYTIYDNVVNILHTLIGGYYLVMYEKDHTTATFSRSTLKEKIFNQVKTLPQPGEFWYTDSNELVEIFTVPNIYTKFYSVKDSQGILMDINANQFKNKFANAPDIFQDGEPKVGETWRTTASQGEIMSIDKWNGNKPYLVKYASGSFHSTRANLIKKLKNASKTKKEMKPLFVASSIPGIVTAFINHIISLELKFPNDKDDTRNDIAAYFTSSSQGRGSCEIFNLPQQWNEAVDYAKKLSAHYAELNKPKSFQYSFSKYVLEVREKDIRVIGDGAILSIDTLEAVENDVTTSGWKTGGYDIKINDATFSIGCQNFTLGQLKDILKAHKNFFNK